MVTMDPGLRDGLNQRKKNGTSNHKDSCNSQICSSYVVGLLACVLIIGGVFLAFQRWDYMWLVVTLIGIILTFVGASLHYCGTKESPDNAGNATRGGRQEVSHSQNEHLLGPPSAPNLGAFSSSQLSLSMLPPYFPSYDAMSMTTNGNGGGAINSSMVGSSGGISPIMQINGQSFLLLPIGRQMSTEDGGGSVLTPDAQSIFACKMANGVSTLQLNTNTTLSEVANEQQRGYIMIKPRDFQQAPSQPPEPQQGGNNNHNESASNVIAEPNLNVTLEPTTPSVSQSTQTCTSTSVDVQTIEITTQEVITQNATANAIQIETEPIYEVPRLVSVHQRQCVLSETNHNEPSASPTSTSNSGSSAESVIAIENGDDCSNVVEVPSVETTMVTSRTDSVTVPIVIEDNDASESRATSPDVDTIEADDVLSPPSYEEVAVMPPGMALRLGMPKYAYETM